MKKIKLGFADTFFGCADLFFTHVLSKKYQIIRDDDDPDYLIFGDEVFGTKNRQYDPNNVLKIFYTGENRRYWDYQCHYAITFDHYEEPYHYRLPLYTVEEWHMQYNKGMGSFLDVFKNKNKDLSLKNDFCGFVHGNGNALKRVEFYNKLSQYKKIDSGGPLFNNIGYVLPRGDDAQKQKIDFFKSKRFVMCFEQSKYPGYVTEKILHAYWANAVPIYWGSNTIAVDFNPSSMLSWHEYGDDEAFIDAIIEVDNNQKLYEQYYNEPALIANRKNKFMEIDRFLTWFDNNVYKG